VIPCNDSVLLGDGTTAVPITGYIIVDILFAAHSPRPCRLKLKILDGDNTSQDVLIGLPALLDSCYDLFLTVVKNLPRSPQLAHTLATPPDHDLAPEDLDTDTPVNFPLYLHYMEIGHDAAIQEYLSLIDTHVDPDFLLHTPVRALLESKGVDVFVPQNWEGIRDVEISLNWKEIPTRIKPHARPINPKLLATAKTEFDRLCQYMYTPSSSDVASPLVIAPKDTPPFVRFCGDYPRINKYIETGHYPIPHVMRELDKIAGFKIFLDLDLVNSFHQFRLDTVTSERLSIVTPWGQVRPLFMPEGIGPASGILQKHMAAIFSDFADWSIVLFDNMLLLAHDHMDAYSKLTKFLDRCRDRNVYLKFSKCFLGYTRAHFFGYDVSYGKFQLAPKRLEALRSIPLPRSLKAMQSFLGTALFYKPFVPMYTDLVAPLYQATHADFPWTDATAIDNLIVPFERLLAALADSTALYYPDYDLQWCLRTDASDRGVGGVLYQTTPTGIIQPIMFLSSAFSPAARKWSTIEKECYACFFCVKSMDYYLRCKPFLLLTDHNNLLWMQSSVVPKIMRWYVYLQSFVYTVDHVAGTKIASLISCHASMYTYPQNPLRTAVSFLHPYMAVALVTTAYIRLCVYWMNTSRVTPYLPKPSPVLLNHALSVRSIAWISPQLCPP
jgi:hypothetical protein